MCTCSALLILLSLCSPFLMFQMYWVFDYRLMLVFTSILGWVFHYVFNKVKEYWEHQRLQKITKQKQEERRRELENLRNVYPFTKDRKIIVQKSSTELIPLLQARKLKAVQVYEAFMAKSIEATIDFNCITEFVPNAKAWAEELDFNPEIKGPLHGLPICIKDDTNLKGMDSTLGYAKNLYKPATKSAILVQILMDLGAVPICKTNIPQTLVSFASDNPIFGETVNCLNKKLAPGGSSSGTGALVGAGGCVLGTGSDIGGSGRIPAHFNGICSIKPTSNRLSSNGIVQATNNCIGLTGVPAIFCRQASTLSYVFKSLTEDNRQNDYDAQALPISWNFQLYESTKKLRIGYFTNLSFFPLMGDTESVVLNAKRQLELKGHTLIQFPIKHDFNLAKIMADLANSDTGTHLRSALYGESVSKAAQMLYQFIHMPYLLRKAISLVFKYNLVPFLKSPRAATVTNAGLDLKDTAKLWDCMGQRQQFINEILQRMKDKSIDCLLCPAFPFPAPKVEIAKDLVVAVIYSMLWNLCDFPAGIVNFGQESGTTLNDFNDQGDMFVKLAKEGLQESIGMPIAVQIVGKPYQEELVLRVMQELDQIANNKKSILS